MLNPPLSLLSFDLLEYIVEFVAPSKRDLRNLSLADRAFTQLCQNHIFGTLGLGYCSDTKKQFKKELGKIKRILAKKPSIYRRIRIIQLSISHRFNAWLLKDKSLTKILLRLPKCRIRPSILHLEFPLAMEDPILVVDRLRQTFFSETLTTLHLIACQEMPLAIFLTCHSLKEVVLKDVTALDDGYDDFPARQCSDYTSPALERFQYRASHTLVEQMIAPPPIFPVPVVLWSSLRVLELSPFERHEMACLQAIVSAASDTLEELYLTQPRTVTRGCKCNQVCT